MSCACPSAAAPEVPPGSSRQQGVQAALPGGVDKESHLCVDFSPSDRGPIAPYPHPTQSLEAFPVPAVPICLFQGDCLQHRSREVCQKGHRRPDCRSLEQHAGPPVRKGGQVVWDARTERHGQIAGQLFQLLPSSPCLFWPSVRACLRENKTKEVMVHGFNPSTQEAEAGGSL